ncbi:MAG: class I SAM-dependent methyltransferase [Acidimicrobiia bacterium]
MTQQTPDFAAANSRQKLVWSSGDYSAIANLIIPMAETLCESVDLRAGERVLDVATGTGNAAICAARRFCDVTGLDYLPSMLEHARRRADAEGVVLDLVEGDAEDLPFPDGSFDVVLSTVGVMFAPNQVQVASEMLRVCRSGGRIGLANWTPDGYVGQLFKVIGRHLPPPPGLRPPTDWGDENRLGELFGSQAKIETRAQSARMPFHSPGHWFDLFSTTYGPTLKAVEAVGAEGRDALRSDLLEAVMALNVSGDDTLVINGAYLEAIVRKP